VADIVLALQGRLRPLGRLEELDAFLLHAQLLRAPVSGSGFDAATRIRAAANRDPDDVETSKVVVLDRYELDAIDTAFKQAPDLHGPNFKALCNAVALARAGLPDEHPI
jgi:hypothetical protein